MKNVVYKRSRYSKQQRTDLPLIKSLIVVLLLTAGLIQSCNHEKGYLPKAKQLVPQKAFGFKVAEVKLLDSPFKESQDAEAKYLLSLNLDRLLAPFQNESGIKTEASPYPGWETNFLPGVALSFYLSGTSRLYALTGEGIYLKNIRYILDHLRKCQLNNGGYLLGSRDGKKVFSKLEEEGYYPEFDNWLKGHGEPYYVMEKLFSGLIDVYKICNIPLALTIAVDLADWLQKHMSHISDEDLQKIMFTEYGGLNWVLADLYAITGNAEYLAMSKRWHDNGVLVPLTKGIDILTGIHANSQFPKVSGLAYRYRYTADSSEWKGAVFFWESVVNHRSYVTGGNSSNELFSPKDSLSHTLNPNTEENCNEYNMLKLTSLLFQMEPRVEFADYMERTLYNHILSAQNIKDGRVCYYLPLLPAVQKIYQPLYDIFSCCVCSAMDSYTRHSEYIYAHSDSVLYLNLFIASSLTWREKGISVRQETRFPFEDNSVLTFKCKRKTRLCLKVRHPYWLSEPMRLWINGEEHPLILTDGYYSIHRTWATGDRVEIRLPMNTRIERMPDDENKIALFYGPVLLAGTFDEETAVALSEAHDAPAVIPGEVPVCQWLEAADEPMYFRLNVPSSVDINLKPFYLVNEEYYSVYLDILTENEWKHRISLADQRAANLRQLEKNTVDRVIVNDEASERDHMLSGTSEKGKGDYGLLMNKGWRKALPPEGLKYQLKVLPNEPVALYCKYIGKRSNEPCDYKIKIDTACIINRMNWEPSLNEKMPFVPVYEETIPIPFKLTEGRNTVTVSFEVIYKPLMPGLMELRVVKR